MQRRGRAQSFRCLEKLEQTLADRKETNGGAGKKYGTNESLFGQRRFPVRLLDDLTTPPGYFPGKHANKIAVQLDRIDHVEGEKQKTRSRQKRDNLVDLKRHLASSGGGRWRKKLVDYEGEQKVQSKENSDPNKAGPKFIAAKISVPRFFRGKTRSSRRLLHLPVFEPDAKIPPSKSRQR